MKATPFFLICGLVMIAPHVGPNVAKTCAAIMLLAALIAWSL